MCMNLATDLFKILFKPNGTITRSQVWCDMDTDGGGWTVFLKRVDGSEEFYREIASYEEGFGDVSREYWLGLDALHAITTQKTYQLRADTADWEGTFTVCSPLASIKANCAITLHIMALLDGLSTRGLLCGMGLSECFSVIIAPACTRVLLFTKAVQEQKNEP